MNALLSLPPHCIQNGLILCDEIEAEAVTSPFNIEPSAMCLGTEACKVSDVRCSALRSWVCKSVGRVRSQRHVCKIGHVFVDSTGIGMSIMMLRANAKVLRQASETNTHQCASLSQSGATKKKDGAFRALQNTSWNVARAQACTFLC